MRKFFASTLAAVTAFGAVAATAAPAEAQSYRRYHRDRDNNDAAAAAIIAGVAGLAIGAAIAGNNDRPRYYGNSYYAPRHGYGYGYAPGYAYGPPAYGYRTCVRKERYWDPYYGRNVTVKRRYPC